MLAPRLRKKRYDQDDVQDYFSSDAPYEDNDPELMMNPVLVHRLQQQKARAAAKQKGVRGTPRSGGLARLGLNVRSAQPPPQKSMQQQLDELVGSGAARASEGRTQQGVELSNTVARSAPAPKRIMTAVL